MSKKSQAETC